MNVGMVFAVIFAIVVMGLVLIFGVDQIINIFCFANEAQTIKAIRDLETEVNNLYVLAEGASKQFDLRIPGDAEFCFVNPSSPGANLLKGWEPDPVVVSLITENGYNLWYTHCTGQNGHNIAYLSPSDNFCMKSGVILYLENKGTYVDITELT